MPLGTFGTTMKNTNIKVVPCQLTSVDPLVAHWRKQFPIGALAHYPWYHNEKYKSQGGLYQVS
jgi:hypothetical protein